MPRGPDRGRAGSSAAPRRRGRPKGQPLSPRELAARRANIRKAHAAPKDLIYRYTEKRNLASWTNLQKAIARRNQPDVNARVRLNALQHGFSARDMEASIAALGEDRAAYARHLRRFAALFSPGDETETRLVMRAAKAAWRRLRLYRALACWERRRLREVFHAWRRARSLPPESEGRQTPETLMPQEILICAYLLPDAVLHRAHFEEQTRRIWTQIIRPLRALVAGRPPALDFRPSPPPELKRNREVARLVDRALDSAAVASPPAAPLAAVGRASPPDVPAADASCSGSPRPLPTAELRRLEQSLDAMFLPATRNQRDLVRRIARTMAQCLARYDEEARRDAVRLGQFWKRCGPGKWDMAHGDTAEKGQNLHDSLFPGQPCESGGSGDRAAISASSLGPSETRDRAQALVETLFPATKLRDEIDALEVTIDRALDALVREVSGGKLRFEVMDWSRDFRAFQQRVAEMLNLPSKNSL